MFLLCSIRKYVWDVVFAGGIVRSRPIGRGEHMRLRVERIGEGLDPREVVVAVQTRGGREELAVDETSLRGTMLNVGWPVGQRDDDFLVELPRETFRGFWRVWVPKSDVSADTNGVRTPA